jgi:D-psicose/D-tagatose/L-ribulose 3-epimerase
VRLSFSNIAWELDEEDAVAGLLASRGLTLVDVAPGKYFPEPAAVTEADLAAVRKLWADRGFAIEGMQALLFGTTGLNLFSDPDDVMFDRLVAVCRIGGGLGAKALTFGSPRQRDRTGLDDAAALAIASDFFGRLGDVAANHGVVVCLEPNPEVYGCNFMTTTKAAADVVAAIGHPAVRLQLDVGAIALNGESATQAVSDYAPLIGHVHASEPKLVVLGDAGAPHAEAAAALRRHRPELAVTIEMGPAPEPHVAAVGRALDVAMGTYGA